MNTYGKKDEISEAPQVEELLKNLEFHKSIQSITHRIFDASNLQEIIIDIKEDIRKLFNIYILNIYLIDKDKNELFTLHGGGSEVKEIRFPINNKTFAGYVALKKKTIHIADAYNAREIKKIHDSLKFDDSMDEITGITTGQILAAPIIHEGIILGVMEIMNSRNGQIIDDYQQIFLDEIEVSLARAFFIHLDFVRSNKELSARLEKLIQDGIITSDQLNQVMKESFLTKEDPAALLINRYNVSKRTLGAALADYYDCPFTAYSDDLHVVLGLLSGIDKSTLINGLWIPLKVLKGKIHVLVDDPWNREKKREIEEILETNFIQYEVGLADDIVKLIERSYAEQDEEHSREKMPEPLPALKQPAEDNVAPLHTETDISSRTKIHSGAEEKIPVPPTAAVRHVKMMHDDNEVFLHTKHDVGPHPERQSKKDLNADPQNTSIASDEAIPTKIPAAPVDVSTVTQSSATVPVKPENSLLPLLGQIIFEASAREVSDIHFEPDATHKKVTVRFRIDRQCFTRQTLTQDDYDKILLEIKTLAGFDLQTRASIQEGEFKIRRPSGEDLHLSAIMIPTQAAVEDTVIRLHSRARLVPLELLGLSEENYDNLVNILRQPRGAVLAIGTGGTQMTSLLHACLENIITPEKIIWTAEDSLDIVQAGLRQVRVDPQKGLDYPRILRSFLNADADVIMAGRIRGLETVKLCMDASLQKRLVLGALQADSISDAIEKCLDMGLDPFLFADGMLSMIEQRTIKSLCPLCREKYYPSLEEYEELAQMYGKEAFERLNIPFSDAFSLYRPKGCESCGQTGYSGRLSLAEILVFTPKIKRMIRRKESVESIYGTALTDGMTTLLQDGISRVLKGQSDSRQVRLACLR